MHTIAYQIGNCFQPLSSVSDMEACLKLSPRALRQHLADMESRGEIGKCSLAATHRAATRVYLVPSEALELGQGYAGWSSEWGLSVLLQHLPMVEHFYQVAATYCDAGGVHTYRWIFGRAIDAAFKLSPLQWISLTWSGAWETQLHLYEKMLAFRNELYRLGVGGHDESEPDPYAYPCLFIFVASDRWQCELVRRAAIQAGIIDRVDIFCASTGKWPYGQRATLLDSRGWIYAPAPERDMGGWLWPRRLAGSVAARPDGFTLYKAIDLLSQWGGSTVTDLAGLVGGERLDRMSKAMEILTGLDLAVRENLTDTNPGKPAWQRPERTRPDFRYGASSKAVGLVANRDRVNHTLSEGTSRALTWNDKKYRSQRRHEDQVLRVMAAFARVGGEVAPGWRCEEPFPGGGVKPDGAVFLTKSPFGPGYHYVEVERRAQAESTAGAKLKGILSENRRTFSPGGDEPSPVLFVVKNYEVEKIFHALGTGVRMLTISQQRWRQGDPMNGWSLFGQETDLHN